MKALEIILIIIGYISGAIVLYIIIYFLFLSRGRSIKDENKRIYEDELNSKQSWKN